MTNASEPITMRHEQATPHAVPLAGVELSVIVPVKNEEQNLPLLIERLIPVLRGLRRPFEVIVVNDGSTDGTLRVLRDLAASHPELRVIDLARNYGQTAAMMAGFDHARGDIMVPIDADLQNDPADIPMLLAKLDEGYDVVSGWRKDRQDAAIRRNFVSRVANRLISRVSGVHLHDYGCSLKAYRRSVIGAVRLYGEMHRFVPIYASWYGARITEIPVQPQPAAARQIQLWAGAHIEGRAGPYGGAVSRSVDRQTDLCVWRLRHCCGSPSRRSARLT